MARLTKLIKFIGVTMFMGMVACKQSINMKALVLSTAQTESDTITLNLNSYGIPYDLIEFTPSNMLKGNLTLYNDNNEPKYNLVVINGGDLIFEVENLWISALSVEQWAYLEEYEAKNGIRRVVISEDVSANRDVELNDPNNWGTAVDDQPLMVEESNEVKKIFNDARVKITAPLNVNGIYHTRVNIVSNNTVPFLYYADNGKKGPVAATLTKYDDGREKMSFFFGFGVWSQTSIILNHLWLTWATRSLYNGFRRVYFTPHIDDVFLSTEVVDPKNNKSYGGITYRNTPEDLQKIAQFQKDVLKIMPEGSFYRVELAFNGNGALISGDYSQALEVNGERYVDIEFVKEPGTGEKRWPKENYQLSSAALNALKKDTLYSYFYQNTTAQQEFFWSSHTFTHENLDNAAKSDVDNEIRLNIEIAKSLGLTDKEYWSGGAIITPQISGLHNKDALDVFRQYGIQSATGDLSRPAICNNDNPYLPFYTTLESSNLEGFPIIPRTPTEVYYFCSTKEEDTWMYNQLYRDYYGGDSTFDDLLQHESERTLLLMTKLRHEAHQFHQANLRYYPKEGNHGESLLEDWTRSVVNLYTKYVDWPLISIKIDQQAETFLERAKLEACGHETKYVVENGKVVSISVSATKGECTVPVTVPSGVDKSSLPSGATTEQIGKDPLTVWVPLKKGESKSFKLQPAFDLNIDVSSAEPSTTTTNSNVNTTTISKTTSTKSNTRTTTSRTRTTRTTTTRTRTTRTTTTRTRTTTRTTTTTTNVSPTPYVENCPNKPYDMCQGTGIFGLFDRSSCCPKGYHCTNVIIGFSQCLPDILFPDNNPATTTTTVKTTTTKKTTKRTTTTKKGKTTKTTNKKGKTTKTTKTSTPTVNQPPVNQPPFNQPPANQPPFGQPPANQPPANQPPFGQPPANQPPANQPPANQPPANQPPANQQCGAGYQGCGDFLFGPTCCQSGYTCRRVLLNYRCLPF